MPGAAPKRMTGWHNGCNKKNVLDDAMWGVFQMDWRAPWGADADHVKEIADLPPFIKAGYTFYTIDPGATSTITRTTLI